MCQRLNQEVLMLRLLLFFGAIAPILCQTVHNVSIPRSQPYEIGTPDYPSNFGWTPDKVTVEWNLQVESDAKIKIVCVDIRMVQSDEWTDKCNDVYLSVYDGKDEKRVCGSSLRDVIFLSNGPTLQVKVVASSKGGGVVKCIVLNTGDPTPEEMIKMDPHDKLKMIKLGGDPGDPLPYLDRMWVFESPPGTRMSFQCDVGVRKVEPLCGWESLRFHNGENEIEFCDYKHAIFFSKGNKAKLRLQLDDRGYGRLNCLVQAITGQKPDEYENVIIEQVDSSEHGVTGGKRQTSCKCGLANKRGARIIDGQETRVNEFPWMVYFDITHETILGSFDTFCGGSILTPRHVLTAAHCVVFNNVIAKPENIKMTLAKHDATKPTGKEIRIQAEKVFLRDLFLQKGLYYDDIAMIFTKETIDFSTPLVGPVCLEKEKFPIINKYLIIMGWGNTEDGYPSDYLRKGKSVVMDPYFCGGNDWDVCTTSTPSSVCSGDSGGPLVRLDKDTNRYTQVSLVSRGSDCRGKYLISTLVSYFYDWIQKVIQETDPSRNTCNKI
uniref:Venom S1 protease 9 n=1 Tax=Platymeris rhadamanthus TaxID=1134088 RepID=A0A6B9KZB8_PLARH|nr:venom S1 protease 9 [Platymeris rhadamanthus]